MNIDHIKSIYIYYQIHYPPLPPLLSHPGPQLLQQRCVQLGAPPLGPLIVVEVHIPEVGPREKII